MVSSTKIPSLSRTYLCALNGVGTLTTVFKTGTLHCEVVVCWSRTRFDRITAELFVVPSLCFVTEAKQVCIEFGRCAMIKTHLVRTRWSTSWRMTS